MREFGFEFKKWTVSEGGVEALGIVDGVEEVADGVLASVLFLIFLALPSLVLRAS